MLDGKPVTPSSTGCVPSLCCNTPSLLLHSASQEEKKGGGGWKSKHFLSLHKPREEPGKTVQNRGLIFIT